jgi:hypothetical protein
VINSIRVLFAAVFVGSFLLWRFVLHPLSKLGFIWLTSGKPIFFTLFGGITAAVVFWHEVYKLLP